MDGDLGDTGFLLVYALAVFRLVLHMVGMLFKD